MHAPFVDSLSDIFGIDVRSIDPLEQLRSVMAWYPNKNLYERQSSESGERIISVYRSDAVCPVISHEEWYADSRTVPSLPYDPALDFFSQFARLQRIAPVVGLLSSMQENAEYCQDSEGLKNCYLVFDALQCRDVYYATRIYNSQDCIDVYWVMDSELLYECVYMFNCYRSRYCHQCYSVADSAFLFQCRNVKNCFFCSNLQNKEYCIFNEQKTKEEYDRFIREVPWEDGAAMLDWKKRFRHELLAQTPRPPASLLSCEDVTGNYLKNVARAERAFECFDVRDAYNIFQCAKGSDIVGSYMCNDRVERCFQSVATGIDVYDVRNCAFVWHSSSMEYCYLCQHCQDCFGCIGLRNNRYYIFNHPYTKEEYTAIVGAVRHHLQRQGHYHRFFPMELSPFPYEDTIASDLCSGSETVSIASQEEQVAQVSVPSSASTEHICPISGKKFRYLSQEIAAYDRLRIPRPSLHPSLRYRARMEMMATSFLPTDITDEHNKTMTVFYAHPSSMNIVSSETYAKSVY